MTVPMKSPIYVLVGKIQGNTAKATRPTAVITGIILTVFSILNLWEKNEKIRSTISWVTKFISTNKPSNEYEML